MDIRWSLHSLLHIWPELPQLLGPSWVNLYPRVRKYLGEIRACRDARERSWLGLELIDVFAPEERAHRRLREVTEWLANGGMRTGTDSGAPSTYAPDWDELITASAKRLEPQRVRRYTDITAPRRLPRGKLGVVTVRLTRGREAGGEVIGPLSVRLDHPVEVHLMTLSEKIEVQSERFKVLFVGDTEDPEPVIFRIHGTHLGRGGLCIDFRQDGLTVGTVSLSVEICTENGAEEQVALPASALVTGGSAYEPPPDFDFRVVLPQGQDSSRLNFVLHSPNRALGFNFYEVPGKRFARSPVSYQRSLLDSLDQLALQRDRKRFAQTLSPSQAERRLAGVGESLWDELFPDGLKTACLDLLESSVTTLQVTSDEGWIPWELVRPDQGDPGSATTWCERFDLTRWCPGNLSQTARIEVRSMVCIAIEESSQGTLSGAGTGRNYLHSWSDDAGFEDLSPEPPTLEAVEELLDRGGVDLWHLASHGDTDLDDADSAVIQLAQESFLRPSDIDRERQRLITARRPLVFLNVCTAGQQGRGLTGLSGWVSAWVRRGHCGALIAPVCTVADDLAELFARSFYDSLRSGATLGRAVRLAREVVRDKAPHDPTWLAYCAFGHPNARLVAGRGVTTTG